MSLNRFERKPIPPAARLEGDFLQCSLPIRAFATLTTLHRTARYQLDGLFSDWIRGVQAHNRVTLGWIKTIENDPQPHIHCVLIAASSLDCVHAEVLWQAMVAPHYSKVAKVEQYEDGLSGTGYILKKLGSFSEDIQLSDNIRAFAPGSGKSRYPTDSIQRRHIRRIKAAMRR